MASFVVLARVRHFARAARELNTTQPAVSMRLAALEAELGCTLVRRRGGDFALTPEGERALKTFEGVLHSLDVLKSDLSGQPAAALDVVRIGAIDTVSSTWMPPLVEALHRRSPRLKVELTIESTKNLVEGMERGAYDLIFALDPVIGESYRSFVSCVFEMSWVGSARSVDPERVYTVEDLAAMPIVTFPRGTPPFRMIAPYFQDEQVLASKLTSNNSLFSIINLVIEGFGIGALPTVTVEREIGLGLLTVLRTAKRLAAMPIIATYQATTNTEVVALAVEQARLSAAQYCAAVDAERAWVE
ncbi:LysR family transcriptional regulator [Prosthecomicrobium sp. N25]|uniref:LysR family transcriptional regulator n=1 Tax=Prosthecomicrobium sp. N25 TaxID=3129254 RepID=UPI003076CE16